MTCDSTATPVALRVQVVQAMRTLHARGLNQGTAGNVAVRCGVDQMLITPSGVPVDALTPERVVPLGLDGSTVAASMRASSEWRMHSVILQHRPEFNAVVHTHSCYATALACLGEAIPAFHYMVAAAGGTSIRCAPYALFGTQELADLALLALHERKACLLGHHGMLACAGDLDQAVELAEVVESLCHQYWCVRQLREPVTLTPQQMQPVLDKFRTYGRQGQDKTA